MNILKTTGLVLVLVVFSVTKCEELVQRRRRSFQSIHFRTPERGGRKCHDFCSMMPDLCRNGGTCVIDEGTCVGSCICAQGWAGKWCKEPLFPILLDSSRDTVNETEMGSEGQRETPKSPTLSALPDGLFGDLGNILFPTGPSAPVSLPTGPSVLDKGHSESPTRQSVTPFTNTSSSENDSQLRESCLTTCNNGNCINVDGVYKCKFRMDASVLAAPKVCGPGFECMHGVCDMEALQSNSYRCICEESYVGQFCSSKCPLECGEHGHCDIHVADNTYKCYCQWNYTGLNCSEQIPDDPEPLPPEKVIFHWYVVGVSVTIVITVMTLLVLLMYCMWRRRLVFILKIVHYFQQYEDEDGKEYDAFVSYKSCPQDEEFVLRQLYPKLERDFQFKLCMHFRDFLPGEAIANNIVKAIESSRRTIMVLSPEYVKSEWCRMEYQKAQHEMLKLKHKIIPIVLEDISEVKDVDKNLKSILNSVTYLEWPGQENSKKLERFWKKLELSLPKKSTQSSNSISTSETSSASPPASDILSPMTEISVSSSMTSSSTEIQRSNDRSLTDSPTPSSSTTISSSPKFQRKRKDFRHFMEKLVRNKFFNRQDSNSSQSALVDEETLASRSSCGSVTESMLTENSEPPSPCSSPGTPRTARDSPNTAESTFFPVYANESRERFRENLKKCKELAEVCEKDRCENSECLNCEQDLCYMHKQNTERNSDEFLNRGFVDDEVSNTVSECDYCNYERLRSDNNRIKISSADGKNKIRIESLPPDYRECQYCAHAIIRNPYRGSMKHCKDAANELMRQKRVGSLPRNYKNSQILKASTLDYDVHVYANTGPSATKGTCYMDVCENI